MRREMNIEILGIYSKVDVEDDELEAMGEQRERERRGDDCAK
jgi:hypothetical protein